MDKIEFSHTPFIAGAVIPYPNRLNWRAEILLGRNPQALQGMRVLDMACTDGRFTYAALRYGAAHVTGVEARKEQVELGQRWIRESGYDDNQFKLIVGDVVDHLRESKPYDYDTILCFGFFYHTICQVEIMKEFARLHPRFVIMDTNVYPERWYIRPGRFLQRFRIKYLLPWNAIKHWRKIEGDAIMCFMLEDTSKAWNTNISNLSKLHTQDGQINIGGSFVPTAPMVEKLFLMNGFCYEKINWHTAGIRNWQHLDDYKKETRVSYLAKPF